MVNKVFRMLNGLIRTLNQVMPFCHREATTKRTIRCYILAVLPGDLAQNLYFCALLRLDNIDLKYCKTDI